MDFKFELLNQKNDGTMYTDSCSGSTSDCCTRVCTRINNTEDAKENTNEKWADYFELNAGLVQY